LAANGGEASAMSTTPMETLELKAVAQRNRLHDSADELRSKIASLREKLSIKETARQHLLGASVLIAIAGLVFGYGFGGLFRRH
jgi:hypothetical protein